MTKKTKKTNKKNDPEEIRLREMLKNAYPPPPKGRTHLVVGRGYDPARVGWRTASWTPKPVLDGNSFSKTQKKLIVFVFENELEGSTVPGSSKSHRTPSFFEFIVTDLNSIAWRRPVAHVARRTSLVPATRPAANCPRGAMRLESYSRYGNRSVFLIKQRIGALRFQHNYYFNTIGILLHYDWCTDRSHCTTGSCCWAF